MNTTAKTQSKDVVKREIQKDLTEYCKSHPQSPAAKRHPRILIDQGRYIALLGHSINRGIVGFGSSVASALRAFDELYTRSHPHAGH
jgi:hypothetical protein